LAGILIAASSGASFDGKASIFARIRANADVTMM
jgi:hypothetical protein